MKALLVILALAISSTAAAFPSQNSNCNGCHTTGVTGGSISVDPSIDLGIGDTGVVTFTLSGIPNTAAIALFGMDASGLDAIIGTPDNWGFNSGGDNPLVSDLLGMAATTYDLTFDVGPGASLGTTYSIEVLFAGPDGTGGNGRWLDISSFDVTVVPIPAAVWLFGSGLLGLVGVARHRRRKA